MINVPYKPQRKREPWWLIITGFIFAGLIGVLTVWLWVTPIGVWLT